jgi:hypothetical protein
VSPGGTVSPGDTTGSAIAEAPPAATARLFPHLTGGVPLGGESRAFLIARLLEEGGSADLAWLTSVVPVDELREWVRARGGRQLSRRSLRFWALVLDAQSGPESGAESGPEPGDELWPR